VSRDTRWEDINTLLNRTERTKEEKLDSAIAQIAAERFAFPSTDNPSYRTYVNVPEVTMGVQAGDDEIVPSIVVTEKQKVGETRLVMTAQVCGREQVHEGEARRIWARCASIPDQAFYLFVPVGFGAEAKRICRQLGIRPAGFRTWRTTPRGFEVNDVSQPPSPIAALMPPLVRRLLATP